MNLTLPKINAWWCGASLLLAGLVIAWLDFRADEVQGTVLLLLITTGAAGFLHPAGAWRWALITGGGIPALHLINRALGNPSPYPVHPSILATLLPLIPSLIGAYAGVLLRRLTEGF